MVRPVEFSRVQVWRYLAVLVRSVADRRVMAVSVLLCPVQARGGSEGNARQVVHWLGKVSWGKVFSGSNVAASHVLASLGESLPGKAALFLGLVWQSRQVGVWPSMYRQGLAVKVRQSVAHHVKALQGRQLLEERSNAVHI